MTYHRGDRVDCSALKPRPPGQDMHVRDLSWGKCPVQNVWEKSEGFVWRRQISIYIQAERMLFRKGKYCLNMWFLPRMSANSICICKAFFATHLNNITNTHKLWMSDIRTKTGWQYKTQIAPVLDTLAVVYDHTIIHLYQFYSYNVLSAAGFALSLWTRIRG